MNTVLLIILIILVVILLTVIARIRARARELSRQLLGTADLMKGLSEAAGRAAVTEKSLSSVTRLMLPEIQKDFPVFNWEQYRLKVQDAVREYIAQELGGSEIEVHRTEISDYTRREGTCRIETQTSAGYTAGGSHTEERFVTGILYIQDVRMLPEYKTGLTLTCPNCGAPVTDLGQKKCAYCGTAIRELNERVWKLTPTQIG